MNSTVESLWHYYLALEEDLMNTSRYVEPVDQDSVYSIEFYKILILAATECESVMKILCKEITGTELGFISDYKNVILSHMPGICNAEVYISRADNKKIRPFAGWDVGPLGWWDSYQECKHSRHSHFKDADYKTAATVMGALYILIFYYAKQMGDDYARLCNARYVHSNYTCCTLITESEERLP